MNSPWGAVQSRTSLGSDTGIVLVETASHGGIYVPEAKAQAIEPKLRAWAAKWSGSENWFEEDCCWAAVAVSFPDLFTADQVETAKRIVEFYANEAKQ